MKKYFKYIYILFAVQLLNSCDIDRIPETEISDNTYWKTASDFKNAANYFYTFLDTYPDTDNWSDDSYGRSSNSISDGTRIAPAVDYNYNEPYILIRACNKLLDQAEAATGIDAAVLNVYKAEAYFFRAYAYYSLGIRYGGVPLILKTTYDNSEELYAPRATREEIFNQILADLDLAIASLPAKSAIANADYGRLSKTAALAFAARAALFEGTRAKFHNYGNPNALLQKAKDYAKQVMDSGQHGLMANYFDMFQYAGERQSENILVKVFGVDRSNLVVRNNYFRGVLEQGLLNPTKSLVDSYLMTDGLPMSMSSLYKMPTTSIEVFTNRDKRLSATVFKEGDEFITSKPIFTIANLGFNTTGFCYRKFTNITDWQNQAGLMDYPIIRYAEVLLIYAEASYELGGSISDADLDLSVNLLRDRAGIARLSNSFVTSNNLNMRDEIRRERRVELAQEGFRYWDLMRWKTAEIELPKEILGNYFFQNEFPPTTINLTSDNYILVSPSSFRSFDPSKDYLWPIPINEISLNPALEQNPGWK